MKNYIKNLVRKDTNNYQPEKFIFFHIPKCAGTSMSKYVQYMSRNKYMGVSIPACKFSTSYDDTLDFYETQIRTQQLAQNVLYYHLFENKPYLGGHVCCDKRVISEFSEKYNLITILRNPVDRWISHYKYHCMLYGNHWIDSKYIEWQKSQIKVFEKFVFSKQCYSISNCLSNCINRSRETDGKAISQEALDHLKLFKYLGFVENITFFEKTIKKDFHLKERYPLENKIDNIHKGNAEKIITKYHSEKEVTNLHLAELDFLKEKSFRETISELCKNDIWLYESAKKINEKI